ncbi:phosphotransferase enzyme family protein [Ferdinandcohnia quinoae]|uniref:Phosphotransferase n=1 Tax=Fredinandcohnia quinoae TaxID=2918902 RepID=A0AAW5DUZ8_9BACI|nr:phosphotransferase [Fredinandcohnia sp. SECRCQ15]MCH1624465.1 phosphotransferase [Fredinandcohnia sp. SECRCQ15]
MTRNEAIKICDEFLRSTISTLYGLEDYQIELISPHEGGRNIVYICEKEGSKSKILRISYLNDRHLEDYLGELEYIRYLFNHGGSVSNVISSLNGNTLEKISYNGHTFFVSLFEKAIGKKLVENHYQYREGVEITEYYYNVGKVLGKLHQLSKDYTPVHSRYNFFDKYHENYIDELIPDNLPLLKTKMKELIKKLRSFNRSKANFGMIHFDYNDGNYSIDFDNGQITVYDFDNSCFGHYMYDLADLWTQGVGWIQFDPDPKKRREFMKDYFTIILDGYRSETEIDDNMLNQLPVFINATIMENIVDRYEVMKNNEIDPVCDEELMYLIKCLEDDIPYKGFFHDMYSSDAPFEM